MSQIRSVRVQVYGIVQGVGFRYFTHQEASKLGLRGRATNLSDGSVEVLAEGDAHAVEKLIQSLLVIPFSPTKNAAIPIPIQHKVTTPVTHIVGPALSSSWITQATPLIKPAPIQVKGCGFVFLRTMENI